jgi:hypothetical protein
MKISYCVISAILLSSSVISAEQNNLNELMEQWLNIESQRGHLQSSWSTEQQQMKQSQLLLDAESSLLKEMLASTNVKQSSVDKKRLELSERQSRLEVEQIKVKNYIRRAIEFNQSIVNRLPPPLQKKWLDKSLLLTQASATDSEKLERLLALYKLVNEFEERVAINRTSMEVPGAGSTSRNLLITQMYLGVSQGWYVSDDGAYYGFGKAGKLGWQWWHNENASAELGRILNPQDLLNLKSILEKPTTAEFINLPIKVSENKDVS